MDNEFHLPPKFDFESQYLADYFGIWSIHEPVFRTLAERCNGVNLFDHMKSESVRKSVEERDARSYQLNPDGIAVFNVRGPMMKAVPSMSAGVSTVRLRQQVNDAKRDPEVRGALLVLDTPGGTVKGNSDFAAAVSEFAKVKPIYAHIEDMCASAGVSVASQCTKIFANSDSAIYGCMGTYGVVVDYSGQAERLGVKVHVVRAGEYKGMGEPGTPITEDQLAEMLRVMNALNDSYVQLIASGLGKPIDSIRALADGRVIVAPDAVKAGLIDGIQSYEQTYAQLLQACKPKSVSLLTSSPQRSQTMADPVAATLAELKQKFPKSTADWREKQLEAGATLPDAALNYASFVEEKAEAERKQHEQQLADAKAKADKDVEAARAEGKVKSGSLGQKDPITANGVDRNTEYAEGGNAVEDFNNAVAKVAGANPDMERRRLAIRQVASQKPDLYQAYLLASNPGKKQSRLITEKLESFAGN